MVNLVPGGIGIITIRGVSVTQCDTPAIADIDLFVEESEMVALLGGPDSEMITLLRAIAALVPLDAGEIAVNGKNLTAVRDSTRLIMNTLAYLPWKTVLENIEFTLRIKGYDEEIKQKRIDDTVRALQIENLLNRYPNTLSPMQRLRASLACAFAPAIDHLLLDDPTATLPAGARREACVLIKKLCRDYPCTSVVATQDVEAAAFLGNRIIIMRDARIARIIDNPFRGLDRVWDTGEFVQFCASLREALLEVS